MKIFKAILLFAFAIAMTLPFGVQCRVVAGRAPKLVIEEAAVE